MTNPDALEELAAVMEKHGIEFHVTHWQGKGNTIEIETYHDHRFEYITICTAESREFDLDVTHEDIRNLIDKEQG